MYGALAVLLLGIAAVERAHEAFDHRVVDAGARDDLRRHGSAAAFRRMHLELAK